MGDHHQHSHGHSHCCDEHENLDEKGILYSLYLKINLDRVQCMNESIEGSGKNVFKAWDQRLERDKYVVSDSDEELLFEIPFTCNVKIKNLVIIGGEFDSHPKSVRLFVNRPQMSFDCAGVQADKEFDLSRDEVGSVEYPLPATKFSNVNHLSIHIPANFGAETTKVYYIGLCGEFMSAFREGVVICTYESRAMPEDHKAEISDAANFQIS